MLSHNLKLFVYALLRYMKSTRDDDIELIVQVWSIEHKESKEIFEHIGRLLKSKKISMPESIKRQRQRHQQNDEVLRGEKYKERQIKGGR